MAIPDTRGASEARMTRVISCGFPGCDAEAHIGVFHETTGALLFASCLKPLTSSGGLSHIVDFMQGPSRALPRVVRALDQTGLDLIRSWSGR